MEQESAFQAAELQPLLPPQMTAQMTTQRRDTWGWGWGIWSLLGLLAEIQKKHPVSLRRRLLGAQEGGRLR